MEKSRSTAVRRTVDGHSLNMSVRSGDGPHIIRGSDCLTDRGHAVTMSPLGVALALGAMAAPSAKPNFIFLLMDDCEYTEYHYK